ncbi:MAG: sulfurtransferase [Flavobacteriaceae bacterium]|nr:sulfurtransferase [Flavobacteriaceae bacterium]
MSLNKKIAVLLLLALFIGCKESEKITSEDMDTWRSTPIIDAKTLSEIIAHPNIKIADVRPKEDYQEGHIPGSISFTRNEISDADNQIPGMRASAAQLARVLGKKGVKENDTLIVYDDRGNPEAARLWCILYANGFTNTKLLNGGYGAWTGRELPTESGATQYEAVSFEFKDNTTQDLWIETEELHSWLKDPDKNITLIDTRTLDEYSGKRQKTNAFRAGHIPGAQRVDWADAIDFHGDHSLKSEEKLKELYGKITRDQSDTIVVYCHSGVRSSFSTFVLTQLLGYKNVRNYDGSWTAWSRVPELPIEQDSITQILK